MNNFHASARLTKVMLTARDQAELSKYFLRLKEDHQSQQCFFEYCKKWKLAPWLYTRLQQEGYDQYFSSHTLQQFHEIHSQTETQNKDRNQVAVLFLREFQAAGIDVIILKGNLFAHTIYQDLGYKRMNDFDILVKSKDWAKIHKIYAQHDYIPLGFGWSGNIQQSVKFTHTPVPFISPNFKCIIGTQWGLKSPTTNYKVDIIKAWATSREFKFYDTVVKQLSPEFNLLHLVLHMGVYKMSTRDCMDVYNLLLVDEIDEEAFVQICREANAAQKAYFTLKLADMCSSAIPPRLLQELRPKEDGFLMGRFRTREYMLSQTQDLHWSYNDHFQDIEKSYLYFNSFSKFHKKVRFYGKTLKQVFWPSMDISLRFIDKRHKPTFVNKLEARFKAPYFSLHLIAQEVGWRVTFFLFIKLFIELWFSLKYYLVPKESYFQYLKRTGVDSKRIQQIVANVQ